MRASSPSTSPTVHQDGEATPSLPSRLHRSHPDRRRSGGPGLAVHLGEPWLADVGFGDNFVDPLRWEEGTVQEQDVGAFRLDRADPYWILLRSGDGRDGFEKEYRFEARGYQLGDFEPGCTYHQSDRSHFSATTVCSLARPDGRVTLRPDRLIETVGGERSTTPITGPGSWRSVLSNRFGIELE